MLVVGPASKFGRAAGGGFRVTSATLDFNKPVCKAELELNSLKPSSSSCPRCGCQVASGCLALLVLFHAQLSSLTPYTSLTFLQPSLVRESSGPWFLLSEQKLRLSFHAIGARTATAISSSNTLRSL